MPSTAIIIGEAMIELRSSANESHWSHKTFAGDTLNCAAAIAAVNADISVCYLTGIGIGERSSQLIDFCALLGVDASGSTRVSDRRLGLYWIENDDAEQRFRYQRDKSAARKALSQGILIPEVGPGDVVIVSGITLAVATTGRDRMLGQLTEARAAGALVGFDVNYRAALWPDVHTAQQSLQAMLDESDIVKASVDDIRRIWDEDVVSFCERVAQNGASEIIVTDGNRELIVMAGGEYRRYRPATVSVLDPSGAGDGFFGTYIGHRLSGVDPFDAVQPSIDVAAQVVRFNGALGYITDTM